VIRVPTTIHSHSAVRLPRARELQPPRAEEFQSLQSRQARLFIQVHKRFGRDRLAVPCRNTISSTIHALRRMASGSARSFGLRSKTAAHTQTRSDHFRNRHDIRDKFIGHSGSLRASSFKYVMLHAQVACSWPFRCGVASRMTRPSSSAVELFPLPKFERHARIQAHTRELIDLPLLSAARTFPFTGQLSHDVPVGRSIRGVHHAHRPT